MDEHEEATCKECGQKIVLKDDGTFARHNIPQEIPDDVTIYHFVSCPGSGAVPEKRKGE